MHRHPCRWSAPLIVLGLLCGGSWVPAQAETPAAGPESTVAPHPAHFPHSFLLPMAVPGRQGSFDLQVNPLLQTSDGSSLDVGGHLSYGLFDWGGVHLRSLGAATTRFTEVIAMVGLLRDQRRTRGLSLLAIVGIPTGPEAEAKHGGWAYLLGATWRLTPRSWLQWDANLHYDFSAHHLVPESGLVARLATDWFASLDAQATLGGGTRLSLLPGLKLRVASGLFVGAGFQFPLTDARDFDRRFYLQLEWARH